MDLSGSTEEQFPIGRVCHQVLLLTCPEQTAHNTDIGYTEKQKNSTFDTIIIPCFADKHHPVALILVRCHDVEFQYIVVVHLK